MKNGKYNLIPVDLRRMKRKKTLYVQDMLSYDLNGNKEYAVRISICFSFTLKLSIIDTFFPKIFWNSFIRFFDFPKI